MTIKDFARLCGCNPGTLRYYDEKDLLKPAKVDPWTGYRHYEALQSLDFIKIKNLQTSGFTIEEIKALAHAGNEEIFDAFSRKIKEQEEKLNTMKQLQSSYQSEMTQMQQKLETMREYVQKEMKAFDASTEFGLTTEAYRDILEHTLLSFDEIAADEEARRILLTEEAPDEEAREVPDFDALLQDRAYSKAYEKHGWSFVKAIYPEFSDLSDGGAYLLLFRLAKDKSSYTGLSNTLLQLLLQKNAGKKISLHCHTQPSEDGENHFWLLMRKKES